MFAAIEWLMRTAIVAYIAKPYFESFLTEMGKDHYELLKQGLYKLYGRVAGPKAPDVTLVSTAGKVANSQPYSFFFSVVTEATEMARFKLLVPKQVTQAEYEAMISAYLEFMEAVHTDSLDEKTLAEFQDTPISSGTILVAYDPQAEAIVPVDPLAGRRSR